MEANLESLLKEIREMEKTIVDQLKQKEADFFYSVKDRVVTFEDKVVQKHQELKKSIYSFLLESPLRTYLIAPVIYSMIVPALLLDFSVSIFQLVCFSILEIPKVHRSEYIAMDRHRLKYLNGIEKLNCDYCGYFNGLIAFVREVAARTEQYYCPIKHALRVKGLHPRHATFLNYGDAESYRRRLIDIRKQLASDLK